MPHTKTAPAQGFGVLLICLAFFLYSVADASAKQILQYTNIFSLCFSTAVCAFALFVSGTLIFKRKDIKRIVRPPLWGLHIVRSTLIITTVLCNTYAVQFMPLTLFYTILFISPLVTVAMGALFFNERLGLVTLGCILAGFCGVLVALGVFRTGLSGLEIPHMILLISALCFALSNHTIRKIQTTQQSGLSFVLYPFGFEILVLGPWLLWRGEAPFFLNIPLEALPYFLLLVASVSCGWMAMAKGLANIPAGVGSYFHYTQIIWGALLGYALFADIPNSSTVAGAVIITLSGVVMVSWRQHLHRRRLNLAENLTPAGV